MQCFLNGGRLALLGLEIKQLTQIAGMKGRPSASPG
jgi:hypothetical protein